MATPLFNKAAFPQSPSEEHDSGIEHLLDPDPANTTKLNNI